jgi:hypothetical protein
LKSHLFFIVVLLLLSVSVQNCRKSDYIIDEEVIIRDLESGTGTITWTKEKTYILEGFVFVNEDQVLTIEEGTIIRARTGQGTASSALIVARGGKIIAEGTPTEPIIFTCKGDDLVGSVPVKSKGLWGGVIILGNARLNSVYNENSIEGIPIRESRCVYGGNNDEDNSGILRYVSIRHGGTNIGDGNEINGLTFGGVGRGTTVEHVEVISNADDGFEFFGGTVNCRYLVAAFCGDDAFDYDEGYRGNGQFWVGVEEENYGDHLLEANGGIHPENGRPYSIPSLYNLTLIGSGSDTGLRLIDFSRNAGGVIANSILVNQQYGVALEYKEEVECSYQQFTSQRLLLLNNIFYDIQDNEPGNQFFVYAENSLDITEQDSTFKVHFEGGHNRVINSGITYSGESLNLVPRITFSNQASYPSDWFIEVSWKGAFGTYNWASGWTLLSISGYLSN